jgi:hypothetical protein
MAATPGRGRSVMARSGLQRKIAKGLGSGEGRYAGAGRENLVVNRNSFLGPALAHCKQKQKQKHHTADKMSTDRRREIAAQQKFSQQREKEEQRKKKV